MSTTTTSLPNHLYAATIANSDLLTYNLIRATLPTKYYGMYMSAVCLGFERSADRGSLQLFFWGTHTDASALRKWLERRFNGKRSLTGRRRRDLKFARSIVEIPA
jgi:hypothetical protein